VESGTRHGPAPDIGDVQGVDPGRLGEHSLHRRTGIRGGAVAKPRWLDAARSLEALGLSQNLGDIPTSVVVRSKPAGQGSSQGLNRHLSRSSVTSACSTTKAGPLLSGGNQHPLGARVFFNSYRTGLSNNHGSCAPTPA
jgi:hypothetical protein